MLKVKNRIKRFLEMYGSANALRAVLFNYGVTVTPDGDLVPHNSRLTIRMVLEETKELRVKVLLEGGRATYTQCGKYSVDFKFHPYTNCIVIHRNRYAVHACAQRCQTDSKGKLCFVPVSRR